MDKVNKIVKNLKSYLKPNNFPKVAFLLAILLILYYFYSTHLKEGFEICHEKLEEYISPDKTSLVLFYADWCGHCKKLKPTWKECSEKAKKNGLNMVQINLGEGTEKDKELSERYQIDGYPTIMLFKNGKAIPYEGPRSEEGFLNALK